MLAACGCTAFLCPSLIQVTPYRSLPRIPSRGAYALRRGKEALSTIGGPFLEYFMAHFPQPLPFYRGTDGGKGQERIGKRWLLTDWNILRSVGEQKVLIACFQGLATQGARLGICLTKIGSNTLLLR